jgi:hypothetical protein
MLITDLSFLSLLVLPLVVLRSELLKLATEASRRPVEGVGRSHAVILPGVSS